MAEIKISELTEGLQLQDTDILVIVQDGQTKKITIANAKKVLKGKDGINGEPGPSNVLNIGTVESGEEASATITGDSPRQTLNLVLPKGKTGPQGLPGKDGQQGPAGTPGKNGTSVECVKVNTEQEAIKQSTENPNNIYFW